MDAHRYSKGREIAGKEPLLRLADEGLRFLQEQTGVATLLGGYLVDHVFEPLMASQDAGSLLTAVFGVGKGSGAGFLFALIGLAGVGVVGLFALDREIWKLEKG